MASSEVLLQHLWAAFAGDDAPEQRRQPYLLIDQSALPRLPEIRASLQHFESRDLLSGESNDWNGASPVVIDIGNARDERAVQHLFAWLAAQGLYACGLHWLVSPEDFDTAFRRLSLRTHAISADNDDYVLRWFDTRILAALDQVLTPEHYAMLVGCCSEWGYTNRQGEFVRLPHVTYQPMGEAEHHIRLSREEESALIELGSTDAVIDLLVRQGATFDPKATPAERYETARGLVAKAHAWGIADLPELAAYCLVALEEGETVFATEAWLRRLEAVKAGRIRFEDALRAANEE